MLISILIIAVILALLFGAGALLRARAAHLWLLDYLRASRHRRRIHLHRPLHLFFCLVDHFEPAVGRADPDTQRRRVQAYLDRLPAALAGLRDADGFPPCQTLFYPVEEADPEHLRALQPLVRLGLADVEVHLHHDNDSPQNFLASLNRAKELYSSFGYLCRPRNSGQISFAFIHGNWALCNSLPDGRWCGVNNELSLLRQAGCYADFTFPSAPSLTQPRTVNRIYYAADLPGLPRSHDFGVRVHVGGRPAGDLLIVQGPLCPNWRRRKFGLLPRLENAEITASNPPSPQRIDLWVRQHIHVEGRPDWLFVKVHTHGAPEPNAALLLGERRRLLHAYLQSRYNDGSRFVLHYVSARQLVNIVKAAEAGCHGNPNDYRDYLYLPLSPRSPSAIL